MPIRRSKVNNTGVLKDLDVQFGNEYLHIKYSRAEYTPKLERTLVETMGEHKPTNMLAQLLTTVIREWDLVDVHPEDVDKPEDKQRLVPVPVTPEAMDTLLGVEALSAIVAALSASQSVDPQNAAPPNDTF